MGILVGTSGWQYDHWRGRFYPEGLPKREWLRFFSESFPTVEVNNTFYNLPKEETFASWRRSSTEGFVVTVKASRFITHIRRLRDCREAVRLLWSRCDRLGDKLGPVLFQLPPNLQADPDRLSAFIRVLPNRMRAAFEFRHSSWERPDVREMLDGAGCALVLADRPGARVEDVVTGGWSYLRFHQGTRIGPWYRRSKLRSWAERIAAADADETFVYFNNDPEGAAIRDARTLAELLRGLRPDVLP